MPKAYVYRAHGGPEVEEFADLPRPVPAAGQVLIAVRAAGVNPVDWKRRSGYVPAGATPPPLPAVLGSEAAGVVVEVGPGVTDFQPGDEVFGNPVTGGYAEYTLLPVELTARKPAGLSFVDAATLPVAAATAYDGVHQLGLPPGAALLITGVGGGVGVAAAQIARHEGLRVIGTASPAKRDFVESLGAVHVPYGPGAGDQIRKVAPEGVDAVFDLVGGDALAEAAELLEDRRALITAADRATVQLLGGQPVERKRNREVLEAVAALAVEEVLLPYVTATYPLEEAASALRAVEDGHAQGKIVIEVTG
ncbi:NADPH:quinone reductase [Planotetraspora thailandica]|uniref:NADPH:quinone reductase n=1 Tax=Planotetraspora thailandica TaxID=487172 RepID=A0A8J3XXA9_9ACTN|nr:NADP-dependent oxidoreductase [Planotetraspora thailandica]GII55895.1 NADPH:quinone reductase [Planotetraspora thailandica]